MTLELLYQLYIERNQFNNPLKRGGDSLLEFFKEKYPCLDKSQEKYLIHLLHLKSGDNAAKYFVADLLYFYKNFSDELFQELLQVAIEFKDPSYNRVFLLPCANRSKQETEDYILDRFKTGTIIERVGICRLYYWFGSFSLDRSDIKAEIKKASNQTKNIVELYFYQMAVGKLDFRWIPIPKHANALCKRIKGNKAYEELLYKKIGWENPE